MIYADHAATTPVSPQALSAMMPYFTRASGNPSALYHLGRQARHAVEKARADIASCLHAQPEQIFLPRVVQRVIIGHCAQRCAYIPAKRS